MSRLIFTLYDHFEERGGSVLEGLTRDRGVAERHCVVSLSIALYPLLSTGYTEEDPFRHD